MSDTTFSKSFPASHRTPFTDEYYIGEDSHTTLMLHWKNIKLLPAFVVWNTLASRMRSNARCVFVRRESFRNSSQRSFFNRICYATLDINISFH